MRLALYLVLLLTAEARAAVLVVRCSPAVVLRGATVHCSASVRPPPPYYALLSRTARVGDHLHTESLHELHAGSRTASWDGPAIASTEVGFTARVGKTELHAAASFTVRARQFPATQLAEKNVACEIDSSAAVLADPPALAPRSTPDEPVPGDRALSRASLTLTAPDFILVDRGPNASWYFVRGPSLRPPSLHILLSRALEPEDEFARAQHGERSLLFRSPGAWPRCFSADVEALHEQLWKNEGCVGREPGSRAERLRRVLAEGRDLNQIFEEMTLPLDDANARDNPFVGALEQKLRELSSQLLKDSQPQPLRVACRLRYPR